MALCGMFNITVGTFNQSVRSIKSIEFGLEKGLENVYQVPSLLEKKLPLSFVLIVLSQVQKSCNKSQFTGVLTTNTVLLLGYGFFNACYMED